MSLFRHTFLRHCICISVFILSYEVVSSAAFNRRDELRNCTNYGSFNALFDLQFQLNNPQTICSSIEEKAEYNETLTVGQEDIDCYFAEEIDDVDIELSISCKYSKQKDFIENYQFVNLTTCNKNPMLGKSTELLSHNYAIFNHIYTDNPLRIILDMFKAAEIVCWVIIFALTCSIFVVKQWFSGYRMYTVSIAHVAEGTFFLRNIIVLLISYYSDSWIVFVGDLLILLLFLTFFIINYSSDLQREADSALKMFVRLTPMFAYPDGVYQSSYRGALYLWRGNSVSKLPSRRPQTIVETEVTQPATAVDHELWSKAVLVERR